MKTIKNRTKLKLKIKEVKSIDYKLKKIEIKVDNMGNKLDKVLELFSSKN